MNILVVGGTRFFGIPMVEELLNMGDNVTLATRGMAKDCFETRVNRIQLDIYNPESVHCALHGKQFDVVIDKMGYGSTDIKSILDNVECETFIHMSTGGVYRSWHFGIKEQEFRPENEKLLWCTRGDLAYNEVKRMAEAAIVQKYSYLNWSCIRSSIVMGKRDYTQRLYFYVEHVVNEIPMFIDNLNVRICFANSEELGRFIAYLSHSENVGAVNYSSEGVISIRELLNIIEVQAKKKAILKEDGDKAPYNGAKEYSMDLEKAKTTGFKPSNIHDWIYELIAYYIEAVQWNGKSNEK